MGCCGDADLAAKFVVDMGLALGGELNLKYNALHGGHCRLWAVAQQLRGQYQRAEGSFP